jgi:hypothetical protein
LREVVVTFPPGKCLFPNEVVEQEAKDEPEAVLRRVLCRGISERTGRDPSTTYSRRNVARGVEKDGHVDVSDPACRITAIERVDDTGHNRLPMSTRSEVFDNRRVG